MVAVRHRLVGLLLLGLAGCAAVAQDATARTPLTVSTIAVPKQKLSSDAETALRATIKSGYLSDLRWPDFKDCSVAVEKFYEMDGFALGWVRANRPTDQANSLIALLEAAGHKGLQPEDYDGPRWAERLEKLRQSAADSEQRLAAFDLALTVSAMRYLADLRVGRVNPRRFDFGFDMEQKRYDWAEFLRNRVVEADDVLSLVAEVEPPFPGYWRAQSALQTYIGLAREYDERSLSSTTRPIRPGHEYADLGRLAKLLQLLNDLPANARVPVGAIYQEPLVTAIKHFQGRHGLEQDGLLDERTIAELNTPLSQRVQQLQFTLERYRWVPREVSQPPIVINIPEFKLRALNQEYEPTLMMNVVVGGAYKHRTPVFMKEMTHVIFRPYWDVPPSITRAELLPEIEQDPTYLEKHAYEIVGSDGRVIALETFSKDIAEQLRSGKLRIRQRPGTGNALGLVKFVFPNPYNVYFHGTPMQHLFSISRRDLSHGCIRVEYPEELAAWVLRNQTGWTTDRIRASMNGERTLRVNLDKPIPVLIVYGTAVVRADGEVHFFNDIYGYDAALERVIAKGYPYMHKAGY